MTQVAREYVTTGPVAEQHVHISWRAVLAGIVVALAVDVLLSLLGFAVGLTAFQPTSGSAKGVGMGIGIWLIITAIASVFAGAYFGARIAGDPWKGDGAAHGVLVWAGFTLISLWLVGSGIGKIMSSAAGLAGSALGALTTSDAASDTRGPQARIVIALTDLGYDADDAQRIAIEAKRAAPSPSAATSPEAQQRAEQTAKEAADKAAAGGAAASWMAFGIALLSLLGGAFGGMLGAIGEQKQVVRYTRRTVRVEPIEPSRPEPIG
jgi:hypothetical protein